MSKVENPSYYQLEKQLERAKASNRLLNNNIGELNLILYHCENGLSHPDLQGKIDKSKLVELEADKKDLAEYAEEMWLNSGSHECFDDWLDDELKEIRK